MMIQGHCTGAKREIRERMEANLELERRKSAMGELAKIAHVENAEGEAVCRDILAELDEAEKQRIIWDEYRHKNLALSRRTRLSVTSKAEERGTVGLSDAYREDLVLLAEWDRKGRKEFSCTWPPAEWQI